MRLILVCLLAIVCTSGYGQTDWSRTAGPEGGAVTDLEFDPSNGRLYALIEEHPYFSIDDGVSWEQLPIDQNFYSDIEISGSNIYILSSFGIQVSTDGGQNFVEGDENNTLNNAGRIRRLSNGNLVVLASHGTFTSTNNGEDWTYHNNGTFNSDHLVVNSADQVFAISFATGVPLRSDNGGVSFSAPTNTGLSAPVYSLGVNQAKTLVYAINATDVRSSTNAASWTSIKSGITDATIAGTSFDLSFLTFSLDGQHMFFMDNDNHKLYSKAVAAGAWGLVFSGYVDGSQTVKCGSARTSSVVVFGNARGIFSSDNGGHPAEATNEGISELRATKMVSSSGGVIVSMSPDGVFSSTDEGGSWSRATNIPLEIISLTANTDVNAPAVVAQQTAMVLNYNPGIGATDLYRSQDGGFSWLPITTPVDFEWVSLTTNNRVYAAAGTSIYYSHNNGANWSSPISVTSLPASFEIYMHKVHMASSTRMLLGIKNLTLGGIDQHYRVDFVPGAGATATAIATLITVPLVGGSALTELYAKNGNFYVHKYFPSPDQFAYSTDGGANWTTRSLPTSSNDEFFVTNNGYIIVGDRSNDVIRISRDNGVSYNPTIVPESVSSRPIEAAILDEDGFGFLAMDREFVHRSKYALVIPEDPTGFTQTAVFYNAIGLQWNDNATTEEYYRLERSVGGGPYSTIANIHQDNMCESPTSKGFYVDRDVLPATAYAYKLTAVNQAGTSATLTVTITPVTPGACTPDIPDGRSWTASNAGSGGYSVQTPIEVGVRHLGGGIYEVSNLTMGITGSNPHQERFALGCNATVVLGLNTETDNIFPNGVGTWNSGTGVITLPWRACEEDKTEIITLTLNANDPAPAAPTGVQALVTGNSSVEVSWTTSYFEKDYVVERSVTSPSGGFSQIGTNINYPDNKLTDNGPFTEGAIYYYRVIARNNNTTPLSSVPSATNSLIFRKPNFVVSSTTVSSFVAMTIGSYWGDFDDDGFDDLLTLSADLFGSAFPGIHIFRNLGNGNFENRTIALEANRYAAGNVVDFDNDGQLDIVLHGGAFDGTQLLDLYHGNGDFTFTKLAPGLLGDLNTNLEGTVMTTSWSDVNRDGRLDLLVSARESESIELPSQLFLRTGSGSYVKHPGGDLADFEVHLFLGGGGLWADYNNDSNPDVLMVDGDHVMLFRGNGDGTFTGQPSSGIDPTIDGAVSAAWGDYTGDGNIDLFLGHANNALYKNNGDGTFTKDIGTSVTDGVPSFHFSPFWSDFNNDGMLDLVVPSFQGTVRVYINTTVGSTASFNKVVTEKISDVKRLRLGAAAADYDKDGFVDIAMGVMGFESPDDIAPSAVNNNLFKNINTTGNWCEVRLKGVTSNSKGVGAQVFVQAGSKNIMREVQVPSANFSQNSSNLHFGLGNQSSITSITVYWPSGTTQVYTAPPINTALTIIEDTQGPEATLLSPLAGATGIGLSSSVEITFNEPVTRNFAKEIQVHRVSDGALVFHQSVGTGVQTVNKYTFTFGSPMGQSTEYEVSFEAGAFTDIYGNAFTGPATPWRFTTSAGPQITLLSPLNNAVNVPSNTSVSITFNVPTTGVAGKKITIFRTSDLATPVRILDAGNAVPDVNKQTLAISPNLPTETAFTVVVEAGAFRDAGNATSTGGQWEFTTMPPPKFTALFPVDEATAVAANTTLQITFDKVVTAEAGKKIRVFKNADPTAVFEANVTEGAIVTNKITFVITPKLAKLSNYTVVVDEFAFKDVTGNLFSGIPSTAWNFTTDQGPQVIGFLPLSGASNVPTTAPVELTFSRSLASAVAGKKIKVLDGATAVVDLDVSTNGTISGDKYTINAPSAQWPAGKTLTLSLDAGAFLDAGSNESDAFAAGSYDFTIVTGPTISSRSPAVGATGVATNTSLEITFDRNITAVAAKSIRVTRDAGTEVVTSDVSANGSISGTAYIYPAPAGGWPSGKLLTVTLDAGAFIDETSQPSAAITGTQWTFTTVAAPDVAPPSIDFNEGAIQTLEKGFAAFTASATITDASTVVSATMFHRKVTEKVFQQLSLVLVNGKWEGQVTNAFADEMGFEYYIEATDAAGNKGRDPAAPANHQSRISFTGANIPAIALPIAGDVNSWKVISIPYIMSGSRQIQTLFQTLGGIDKKKWRLLTYSPTPPPALGSWDEYPEFSSIERGKGYFINTRNENPISITLTGASAPTETRDNLFQMQLVAGWNQIGNPYTVAINWNDARAYNATANLSELTVYNAGYRTGNALDPGQGGFVFVQSAVTISVPFAGQTSPGRVQTFATELDQPNWKLPLTLTQNGTENTLGAVGMHPEATISYDEFDNVTPPRFIDFLEIRFDHADFTMGTLSKDIVPTTDDYMWEFNIESNQDHNAALRWDNTGLGSGSDQLYLFDITRSIAINMREESVYDFDPKTSRKFRIFFGKDARDRIKPEHSLLGQPYPNPTSGISYIPFALPDGKAEYGVKIEVFDLMGRKVTTLEDGQFAPGLYNTQWNGQDSPHGAGLYSIRMTVVTSEDQEVYNAKIVLNK